MLVGSLMIVIGLGVGIGVKLVLDWASDSSF
jgi:hypothetical protein